MNTDEMAEYTDYTPTEEEIQAARDYIADYLNVGYYVSDKVEYKKSKLVECHKSCNNQREDTVIFVFDPTGCDKEDQRFKEFFDIDSRYENVKIEAIHYIESDSWNVQGTSGKEVLSYNRYDDDHYKPSEEELNEALREINNYATTEVHDLVLESCYKYRDIFTKNKYMTFIFGFTNRDEEVRIHTVLNEKFKNVEGSEPVDPRNVKDSKFCVTHDVTHDKWIINISMAADCL